MFSTIKINVISLFTLFTASNPFFNIELTDILIVTAIALNVYKVYDLVIKNKNSKNE